MEKIKMTIEVVNSEIVVINIVTWLNKQKTKSKRKKE